jgi:hypothetical protein
VPDPAVDTSAPESRETRYRPVPLYKVHGGAGPLSERISEVLPENVDYVIFDLDRTVHIGVTIGEQLGWELIADSDLSRGTAHGSPPPIFSWGAPMATAVCLGRGLRVWAIPGLVYASTVKLGDRWDSWGRYLCTRLGPGYVARTQAFVRSILMSNLAGYSRDQLDVFAERAWRRWLARLVVTRDVIDEIRRVRPGIKGIILSSASTSPTVAHAARALGVDGFVASDLDVRREDEAEIYAAPVELSPWFRRRRKRPDYYSRPGAVTHNAAENKVRLLRMAHPEVFSPQAVTLGITDNNYGEDKTWAEHLHHVIALNSRHPFSPFVSTNSPCESVQTIDASPTRGRIADSKFDWIGTLQPGEYDAGGLFDRFAADELGALESLAGELRIARSLAGKRVDSSLRTHVATAMLRLTDAVERYNHASDSQKKKIGGELEALTRTASKIQARIRAAGRDVARIQHEIERLHARAARSVASRS